MSDRAPPPPPVWNTSAPASMDAVRLMQYDASKKSAGLAYLLWFFLGGLGVHRFYLGQTGTGIVMAILFILSWATTFIVIGFFGLGIIAIWWIVDAFLIPGIAMRVNQDLAARLSRV